MAATSRVATATEMRVSRTRVERVVHPDWLGRCLIRPSLAGNTIVLSVHAEHMGAGLCAYLNELTARVLDAQWWEHSDRIKESTGPARTIVRLERVPTDALPTGTPAVAVEGARGMVWLVDEDGISKELAAQMSAEITALVNGGTWVQRWQAAS